MGERDVDDGRVEHHHELRGCDHDEGQAETALASASRCSWAPSPGRGLCGGHVISLREGRTELTRRRLSPGVEVLDWVETSAAAGLAGGRGRRGYRFRGADQELVHLLTVFRLGGGQRRAHGPDQV